jgi:protein disulfide-isomerase A1
MIKDLFVVLFLIFVSAAVPQLTSTNFESYLSSHELVFVKFFSPHCGHCVSMASEYEKLSEQSQGKKYTVVEVDCNTEDELCTS